MQEPPDDSTTKDLLRIIEEIGITPNKKGTGGKAKVLQKVKKATGTYNGRMDDTETTDINMDDITLF